MTREEAITILKAFMENPLFSDVHKQAFNIAIKALEQELCDDCISRNKVLEGKVIHQSCNGAEIINSYAVPIEYIEQLPPVNPQLKTDDRK